jgi:TPR repeat protein
MFMRGEGLPHDHIQAFAWLLRATRQGDKSAADLLARLRDHMTPAERIDAEQRHSPNLHAQVH